jgi:hypothetical protein
MWKDFKAFIMKGNVLDLAVAVIIGGAFGAIVTSLVNDVIMPPIGMILGHIDFKDLFPQPERADLRHPRRSQEGRRSGDRVWEIPEHRHQLPDHRGGGFRRWCELPASCTKQPAATSPTACRADHQRLPVLRDAHTDSGQALPAVHVAAYRLKGWRKLETSFVVRGGLRGIPRKLHWPGLRPTGNHGLGQSQRHPRRRTPV